MCICVVYSTEVFVFFIFDLNFWPRAARLAQILGHYWAFKQFEFLPSSQLGIIASPAGKYLSVQHFITSF
jgi:hypothetical protein